MITGRTRTLAVLGHPVAHSRSPEIHGALLAEHGVDAVYVALDVPPERAPGVPDAIRALGLWGCNLTVPLKEAVVPGLDALDPWAAALGAVNTISARDGRLFGFNTDAPGWVASIEASFPGALRGAEVAVLGAGGAALAVGLGAASAGAASVRFANRTPARAAAAAARGAAFAPGVRFSSGALGPGVIGGADVVVVATAPGAADVGHDGSLGALRPDALVCDLNYWYAGPSLRAVASAAGHPTDDGLGMLAWQAALAFGHFTGLRADGAAVLARLRAGAT